MSASSSQLVTEVPDTVEEAERPDGPTNPRRSTRSRVAVRRAVRLLAVVLVVGVAVAAVVISFVGLPQRSSTAVQILTDEVERGTASTQVSGAGVIQPAVRTELAFGATTGASATGGAAAGSASRAVTTIAVKVGQRVSSGQTLAVLDRTSLELDVTAAQRSYDAAVEARDDPATTSQGGSTTQDQSDEQLDLAVAQAAADLRSAEDALDAALLTAPHGGIVDAVNITRGAAPTSGTPAVVLRGSGMRVRIDVPEDDVVDLRAGQAARVHITALDIDVDGTVTAIDADDTESTSASATGGSNPSSSSSLVTFPVDIVLASVPKGLRSGMSADATVTTAARENVLLVPVTAVVGSGENAQVRVPDGSGGVRMTAVTLGLVTAEQAEVTAGLDAGDSVVTGIVREAGEDEEAATTPRGGGLGGGNVMGGGGPPPGFGGMGGRTPGAGGGPAGGWRRG